jgi:hypothetical protein
MIAPGAPDPAKTARDVRIEPPQRHAALRRLNRPVARCERGIRPRRVPAFATVEETSRR